MPFLYIITGSNGAGKSSIGPEYLPESLQKCVFDGDKLLLQKRKEFWKSGIKSPKECNKLASEIVQDTFDTLIKASLDKQQDFAYEGHFTNDSTWEIPKKFKNSGYTIILIFFGLVDTELSQLRVATRTQEGGHYVDFPTLQSNFYGNLEKLDIYYEMFDLINIYDTSSEHIELARLEKGIPVFSIDKNELPLWFTTYLKKITHKIIATRAKE
ncbi:TPA: zeta toxin family protein [Elizabethkingia anophelis]